MCFWRFSSNGVENLDFDSRIFPPVGSGYPYRYIACSMAPVVNLFLFLLVLLPGLWNQSIYAPAYLYLHIMHHQLLNNWKDNPYHLVQKLVCFTKPLAVRFFSFFFFFPFFLLSLFFLVDICIFNRKCSDKNLVFKKSFPVMVCNNARTIHHRL